MNSPRPPRKTILTSLTNLIQGGATKVKFSQLKLKPNAKVPEVWVQLPEATKAEVYPLLGDRYLLGRSSQSCDIVIRNALVSQTHASITRDPAIPRSGFGDEQLMNLMIHAKH
jgi:penicillin-binding protein 1A